MEINVVRTITSRAKAEGYEDVTRKNEQLAGSQERVAIAADKQTRAMIGVDRAQERYQRQLDQNYRSIRQAEQAQLELARSYEITGDQLVTLAGYAKTAATAAYLLSPAFRELANPAIAAGLSATGRAVQLMGPAVGGVAAGIVGRLVPALAFVSRLSIPVFAAVEAFKALNAVTELGAERMSAVADLQEKAFKASGMLRPERSEVISTEEVNQANILNDRMNAAVKLIEERWLPLKRDLVQLGVQYNESWVIINETMAEGVKTLQIYYEFFKVLPGFLSRSINDAVKPYLPAAPDADAMGLNIVPTVEPIDAAREALKRYMTDQRLVQQQTLQTADAGRLFRKELEEQKKAAEKAATVAPDFTRDIERMKSRRMALEEEIRTFGDYSEATRAVRIEQDMLNRARERGIELGPQQQQTIKDEAVAIAAAEKELERLRRTAQAFEQVSSSFINPFLSAMEQGKSAAEAFRAGLQGVGNQIQSLGTQMLSKQLGNLFTPGATVNVDQLGAGASIALIGTAISGLINMSERREQRRREFEETAARSQVDQQRRLDVLRERRDLLGLDSNTLEGRLAAFDIRARSELSAAQPGGKGGKATNEGTLLEDILARERLEIIKQFNEDVIAEEKRSAEERERIRQGFLDREFFALTDASTREGALAEFDRRAMREREQVAREAAETLPELERALAAERLQVEREFAERSTEEMRRIFEDASSFLESFRRDIDAFLSHFDAGPQSLLSPTDRLLAAQSAFSTQYSAALGGDRAALSGITGVFTDLVEATRGVWGSTAPGASIISGARSQLEGLPDLVTAEQLVVDAIEAASASNDAALADLIALMDANGDGIVTTNERLDFIRTATEFTRTNTANTATSAASTATNAGNAAANAATTAANIGNSDSQGLRGLTTTMDAVQDLMHLNLRSLTDQSGWLQSIADMSNEGWRGSVITNQGAVPFPWESFGSNPGKGPVQLFETGGVLRPYQTGIFAEHHPRGPFTVTAGSQPIPITPAMPPGFAGNDNGSSYRELLAEVKALRAEVAALRRENNTATIGAAEMVAGQVAEGNRIASATNRRVRRTGTDG